MLLTSLLIFNIVFALLISLYVKLTCGICKCSRHLVGKVVIVTGANRGIGFETARDLAERGARVVLACRNNSSGEKARDKIIALTANENVHYRQLDLASLASVRNFAKNILATEQRLDILINNAGVIQDENLKTEDGLSLVMQVNYFGPFLLTNLLLPLLKSSAPSRVINVSSTVYRWGEIDLKNLNMEKVPKDKMSAYCNTKLCNVLMTVELAKRLLGTGVTANCLHPGMVRTGIVQSKWASLFKPFLVHFTKTEWEGAQTSIYLAVSPEVNEISGSYFSDCLKRNTNKLANDTELARKLWEVSEELVNLKS